jgi:translation initiation factor 1
MICKFEKRKEKNHPIIEGNDEILKSCQRNQTKLSVGGTFKDDSIIIQGITAIK